MPTCQVCGHEIKGKPYHWNDDERLPCHSDMRRCGDRNPELFADFLNRNVEYVNGRGEPVLFGAKED